MDSLINAAARALAIGDPLGALKLVALRGDAPGLALRGIAMAQLGEYARSRALLRSAGRAFGAREAVARARCAVAEAEVALAARELSQASHSLDAARDTLERHGDHANAAHARYLAVRHALLLGRLDEAGRLLAQVPGRVPAPLRVTHELALADIALRRLDTRQARASLTRARRLARGCGIPALMDEVEAACATLTAPAAHLISAGEQRALTLGEVEAVLGSGALIVDACRHAVRQRGVVVPLARRPVLFSLVRELARAWPQDVTRETLIAAAFRLRLSDESHRARLRVEMGRLRRLLRGLAQVRATRRGFALLPRRAKQVQVLALPIDAQHAQVLALLADGANWSTSALAVALGTGQRTVQRALDALASGGKVQAIGNGRARRWITPPLPGITTLLLLPSSLPTD